MCNFIKGVLSIIKKDLALEFRTKEIMNSMLVFALLVVVVFSFIFEPGEHEQKRIAGGVYWMALIFSGLLGLGKSMQSEMSGNNLEALLLAPIGRNAIFFGKTVSNLLFMLIIQVVMVPLFIILYDVNLLSRPDMALTVVFTTYGFVLLGTLFSLMAARSRAREIMLPLLLLPVLVPIILAAIQITNAIVLGEQAENYIKWLRLIIVYDIIFTSIIPLVFESVVEE